MRRAIPAVFKLEESPCQVPGIFLHVSAAQEATAAAQAAQARAERGERALVQSRQLLREAQAAADALQASV
eukprot:scaffold4320_cov21-Tisochrysis_lutea.AAC.3